jgi:hypothetical protein
MKKLNVLTLAFIISITVGVALASFMATRPIPSDLQGQGTHPASAMNIPF